MNQTVDFVVKLMGKVYSRLVHSSSSWRSKLRTGLNLCMEVYVARCYCQEGRMHCTHTNTHIHVDVGDLID